MASNRDENYFEFCLKCYSWSGLRKSSNFFLKIVSTYVVYPLMLIVLAMMIYNVRYNIDNISEFAEVFISVVLQAYMIMRKTILLKYGSLYENVLQNQNHYWNYDLFGKIIASKLDESMKFRVAFIKIIGANSFMTIILVSISPFFLESKILPQACWIPRNNLVVKNIIYILEVIFYLDCVFPIVSFEGLYLLMTTNLRNQFILLQKAVESITLKYTENEETLTQLKKYNQYHTFLLSMHKKINKIYSAFFVCNYLLNIGGTCVPLFIISDRTSDITQVIQSIFIACLVNSVLIMTFIPASEIEIEGEQLALQIYSINWYETKDIQIRKFILFWLMQAQVPVQMIGGGMLIINRSLMIQIQRIGYSLSTLLRSLN